MPKERKKVYTINLNVFISDKMMKALEDGTEKSGFPSLSSYVRRLLSLGLKRGVTWEE